MHPCYSIACHSERQLSESTMHLSKVEVKNFRCLRDVTVEFQTGLNVLVGRNNVGKTSLLQAIRYALGSAASQSEPPWLSEDDFYRAADRTHTTNEIEINLTFAGLSEDERAFFYEIVSFDHAAIESSVAVVRFRATWNADTHKPSVRRTGGMANHENAPDVPSDILSALPITFLPALRDAEASLAPGYRSRLAVMLRKLADRGGQAARASIETIFSTANESLENEQLIRDAKDSLKKTTSKLSGSDYTDLAIKTGGVDFDRILRSLQVLMPGAPIDGLHGNGLGYNNLLYIAVVLEHLRLPSTNECPLLLVEEPEAHLHPQLVALLAKHLSSPEHVGNAPQTLVSTHSPTLAACIPTERIHLFFEDPSSKDVRCNSLAQAGLDAREARAVARMMDVTRASMYFAKGLLLVEGVSELLVIPPLARQLGIDLTDQHIAVIPMCGVGFGVFSKLLGPGAFGVRTAIVTDADPATTGDRWQEKIPSRDGSGFELSARTAKLVKAFDGHPTVLVAHSKLTLEYDLVEAAADNAAVVAQAWEDCFDGAPRNLTVANVTEAGQSADERALLAWRAICHSSSAGSKADLAHRLADRLSDSDHPVSFVVPDYLERAIKHVAAPAKSDA
jgi:putative ATP-dependent endonuclease of OLD family